MNSQEIKVMAATDLSTNGWLKELAFQMARLNEALTPQAAPEPIAPVIEKRGPGRPRKVA